MSSNKKTIRCVVYTRKSSEEGLEQAFNSLDAQREAGEAYIHSQKHEGWTLLPNRYDDSGISGGTMERQWTQQLLADVRADKVDVVVVYKVDRLSRFLGDFAQIINLFDKYDVSFVSVTQQFNTTSSMGRLTLNILLSFAQFEREVTGERIRDKIALSKKKGIWMGGHVPLGYDVANCKCHPKTASICRNILIGKFRQLQCEPYFRLVCCNFLSKGFGWCPRASTSTSGPTASIVWCWTSRPRPGKPRRWAH
jgi:DNA invertase Pin-like site-specific DNA recombinase